MGPRVLWYSLITCLRSDHLLICQQGSYAIKLAQASNIHPIIAIAGRGQSYVETLITRTKGDTIIDYRRGDNAIISSIKEALQNSGCKEVKYAFDAVSEHNSYQNLSQVLSTASSKITLVLPWDDYKEIPSYIEKRITMVGIVHMDITPDSVESKFGIGSRGKDFGFVFFRFISRGLQEGWFTAHPYEVIPGGLYGIEEGLSNLKRGVNSASKYIFEIGKTKGFMV